MIAAIHLLRPDDDLIAPAVGPVMQKVKEALGVTYRQGHPDVYECVEQRFGVTFVLIFSQGYEASI